MTIEKKNKELEEIIASKDEIFSIISHDLKGPIGNIKMFFDFMVEDPTMLNPENIPSLILEFKKSIGSTYSLLENLLSWANSERGTLLFQPEKLNIKDVILSNVELLTETAKTKDIIIEMVNVPDYTIYADEHMVSTVVRNLIANALKFTKEQGFVKIESKKTSNNFIGIFISDNGIGISEKELKKIFDKKQHYSTPGTNNEMGSGLGLLLCSEFVDKNGGEISVESVVDEGSTFTITFPESKM